jgi:hypothetical protein
MVDGKLQAIRIMEYLPEEVDKYLNELNEAQQKEDAKETKKNA